MKLIQTLLVYTTSRTGCFDVTHTRQVFVCCSLIRTQAESLCNMTSFVLQNLTGDSLKWCRWAKHRRTDLSVLSQQHPRHCFVYLIWKEVHLSNKYDVKILYGSAFTALLFQTSIFDGLCFHFSFLQWRVLIGEHRFEPCHVEDKIINHIKTI